MDWSSPQGVLRKGMSLERDGYNFYMQVADRASDRRGKAMFIDLANQEKDHLHLILAEYQALEEGKGWLSFDAAMATALDFDPAPGGDWNHETFNPGLSGCTGLPYFDRWNVLSKDAAHGQSYHYGNGPGGSFNKLEFGSIDGIPRLLDCGQCNDAYSAVQIAVALAKAFDCGVNELPLSLILSWYEQKAVAILLTLLHLGIRNIKLGPTLPAFVSPAVLKVLVEKFNIAPVDAVDKDLAGVLGASKV